MKYQNQMDAAPIVQPAQDNQFMHTTQAGVQVPLLQSVVTGLLIGLCVLALAIVFDAIDPWKPALVAAMLGMVGWWVVSLAGWKSLTKREQVQVHHEAVDHDNDPVTPQVIRVELSKVKENGHYSWNTFDLPDGVTNEMMSDLANGILNMHRKFTELEWCGTGKTFSMPKFRQLRALLEINGMIELINPKDKRQGVKFNSDGEQLLQGFLS